MFFSVPGELGPFHWTVMSLLPGLDSKFRSVGGDKAEFKMKNRFKKNKM